MTQHEDGAPAHGKRPSRYDEAVIKAAVEAMWPLVAEHLEAEGALDEEETQRHKEDLARAFQHEEDAYRVARALERDGWDPDGEFVDVLEACIWKLYEAERTATKVWVAAGGVKMDLPVGTRVRHRSLKEHIGEIIDSDGKHDPKLEGRYLVFCAELGHVRGSDVEAAMRKRGGATTGIHLNAEEIEVVEPVP